MAAIRNNQAFSLVELSIVLVILGLLTGGILAGQSLIRASELRAVTSEYERYIAATQTFRDKYFAVPGDFRDATKFWGRLVNNVNCVTNSSAAVATPGACDGNGDGIVVNNNVVSASGEMHQYWRQLALAGLIEGNYTGIAGPTSGWDGGHVVPGTNAPASKISRGGWTAGSNWNNFGDAGTFYAMNYGNNFHYGASTTSTITQGAILRPEEQWNIDTKMDDGKPGRGRIIAVNWSTCTLAASNTDLDAAYDLADSTVQCSFRTMQAY